MIRDAGVGIAVESSTDIAFDDINIRGTPVCYDVSDDSEGITLDDVSCGGEHGDDGDRHDGCR